MLAWGNLAGRIELNRLVSHTRIELPEPRTQLEDISAVLLAQSSSPRQLSKTLEHFVQLCDTAGGIGPDPAFDAWAGDSFLADGVAIAPQAAAHCARDYRRSVVFIRGVYAAIEQAKRRFPGETLHILYAGCGPYATLLLPLLTRFDPAELDISLLDIHQRSLDSVDAILKHFDLAHYAARTVCADACTYRHPCSLHLVISETMQKSLEQEPQFAVTAQLAPQLHEGGIFIPGKIAVRLCLAQLDEEQEQAKNPVDLGNGVPHSSSDHYNLGSVLTLTPEAALPLLQAAVFHEGRRKWELPPAVFGIPELHSPAGFAAALFTRIQVYGAHWLEDYDAEITLPQRCTDLSPLVAGERWEISYQLGGYPRFDVRQV